VGHKKRNNKIHKKVIGSVKKEQTIKFTFSCETHPPSTHHREKPWGWAGNEEDPLRVRLHQIPEVSVISFFNKIGVEPEVGNKRRAQETEVEMHEATSLAELKGCGDSVKRSYEIPVWLCDTHTRTQLASS